MELIKIAKKYDVDVSKLKSSINKLKNEGILLYAMSGKMGAGKDTIGDLIKEDLENSGHKVSTFSYSTPMKQEITDIIECMNSLESNMTIAKIAEKFNANIEEIVKLKRLLGGDSIYERTDASRLAIQFWGTGVRRKQNPNYWINKLIQLILDETNKGNSVFISDVRFENEADSILDLGGKVIRLEVDEKIRIERIETRDGLTPSETHLNHLSETALDNYNFEIVFDGAKPIEEIVQETINYLKYSLTTKNNKSKGLFITLEGPDGSGKSTASRFITRYLDEKKIPYVLTREPGGTVIGEKIRNMVLDNDHSQMTAKTEALLYAASRAQHVEEKIKPLLDQGLVVISDRFVLSSLAYQGYARDIGIEEVKMINDFAIEALKEYKNNIIFLDVNAEVALSRIFSKRKGDRLENEGVEFHNKVHKGYKESLELLNCEASIINADKGISDTLEQIEKVLDTFFKGDNL